VYTGSGLAVRVKAFLNRRFEFAVRSRLPAMAEIPSRFAKARLFFGMGGADEKRIHAVQ
jgi:hypothetical protein